MENTPSELFSSKCDKTNTEEIEYNFEENLIKSVKKFKQIFEHAPQSDPVLQLLKEVSEKLLEIQEQDYRSEQSEQLAHLPNLDSNDIETCLASDFDLQEEQLTEFTTLTVCDICGADYHIIDLMKN